MDSQGKKDENLPVSVPVSDPEPENEPIRESLTVRYLDRQLLFNVLSSGMNYLSSVKNYIFPENDPVGEAEDRLLRCLKHRYYRYYVDLECGCRIWTLSSLPHPLPSKTSFTPTQPSIVFIHGLLSGLAYWAMNFDCLVEAGYAVYALDLPGFARSSRIQFTEDAEETEKIFVDKLEEWRRIIGLDNMILIGHSFGGFITTSYALTYSEHILQIILVDPWGFNDVREEITSVIETGNTPHLSSPLTALPVWARVLVMIFMPFSPFTFLRLSGKYLGPKLISYLRPDMTRRFVHLFGEDDEFTVPNYIYHTNKLTPTGEYAFRSMSMPLAWAKRPLIKRISQLDKKICLSFIYGSRSWIDFRTGFDVKAILTDSEVNVHVIDGAGHHLFADEPQMFNSLVLQIIKGCANKSDQPPEDINAIGVKDLPLI